VATSRFSLVPPLVAEITEKEFRRFRVECAQICKLKGSSINDGKGRGVQTLVTTCDIAGKCLSLV